MKIGWELVELTKDHKLNLQHVKTSVASCYEQLELKKPITSKLHAKYVRGFTLTKQR